MVGGNWRDLAPIGISTSATLASPRHLVGVDRSYDVAARN